MASDRSPFISQLLGFVADGTGAFSWNATGTAVIIDDKLAPALLAQSSRSANLASFVRQLNFYGEGVREWLSCERGRVCGGQNAYVYEERSSARRRAAVHDRVLPLNYLDAEALAFPQGFAVSRPSLLTRLPGALRTEVPSSTRTHSLSVAAKTSFRKSRGRQPPSMMKRRRLTC